MNPTDLLAALHTAERLKDTTRHCCTSHRLPESVAEHSWRIALMAFWLRDEFPQADTLPCATAAPSSAPLPLC